MRIEEISKAYAEKAKQYGLPSWEELNEVFFLSNYLSERREVPPDLLILIANTMNDYIGIWVSFCHNLIIGNQQSMVLMQEAQFYMEEEKNEISNIMSKLTIITRIMTSLYLENDEKLTAEYIKNAYASFKEIREQLKKYSNRNVEEWKKLLQEGQKKKSF